VIALACRDGGAWRWTAAALQAAAVAAVAAWLAGPAAAVLGVPLLALALRRPPAPPQLSFDGRSWQVDGAPADRPAVALDLGGWMLLDLGRGRFAPVSPAGGADWPRLRAALYGGG
jgi:hypothetical protein